MTPFPFSRPPEPHTAPRHPPQLRGPCVWSRIHLEGWKGWLVEGWRTSFPLQFDFEKILSPKFFHTEISIHIIQVFNLFFERERGGGEERKDERFLRDIFEFSHLKTGCITLENILKRTRGKYLANFSRMEEVNISCKFFNCTGC